MADTIPGDATTAANVTVGSSTFGTIETTGDHDWYRIELTQGQAITVALDALPSGTGPLDAFLIIRNSAGQIIYQDDDIHTGVDTDALISFAANLTDPDAPGYNPSGVFYIDVGAFENSSTGDFQLNVSTWTEPPVWTNDQIAEQLNSGYWGDGEHPFDVASGGTLTVDITGLTAAGQELARQALQVWSDITGINFDETTSGAQITFTDDDPDGGAFTEVLTYNGNFLASVLVNIDQSWLSSFGSTVGSYTFQAYLHEIGHALGLGHAGNYNDQATYPYDALYLNDSVATSVMSYFEQTESSWFADQGFTDAHAVTPMVADILAVQQLYGLSTTTRSGNTTYGFNSNAGEVYDAAQTTGVAYTIFDTGGTDTLDYSGYSSNQRIDLNPEAFSNVGGEVGNVNIARGTVIENAIGGSGADVIIGNSATNNITGGNGNDTIDGGIAADIMRGGAGNDTYYVGNAFDKVIEYSGSGSDTVYSTTSFTLGTNVETLRLLGSSSINATGNSKNNLLVGNSGANILNGGAGGDIMEGGAGNDTYYVDNAGDGVIEFASSGSDYVYSTISYTLGPNLENLRLLGSSSIDATGNSRNNLLVGNSAANTLDGNAGADKMGGGAGNDTYRVDNVGDQVIENAGSGSDTVFSTISFTLGDNVESLRLFGSSAINATGNGLDNVLAGNSGANVLDGGAGDDKLYGGKGVDQLWGGTGADEFAFGAGQFGGFTAATAERIHDFSQADGDFISLGQMDANSLVAGNQGFSFIGNQSFHNVAGELRYVQSASFTYVFGDTNGDGTADFLIVLDGQQSLTSGDFLL